MSLKMNFNIPDDNTSTSSVTLNVGCNINQDVISTNTSIRINIIISTTISTN